MSLLDDQHGKVDMRGRRRRLLFLVVGLLVGVLFFARRHRDFNNIQLISPDKLPQFQEKSHERIELIRPGELETAPHPPISNNEPRPKRPSGAQIPARLEVTAETEDQPKADNTAEDITSRPAYCAAFPDDQIAIAVKTGATEALDKLPSQLLTSLRCVSEPMLFSDLQQVLGSYQIHNILEDFPLDFMQNNRDFDLYRQQQDYVAEGRDQDIPKLANKPMVNADWRTPHKNAAWELDKYKFLHMVERAWKMQPGRDWYVFIEADTYMSFANLLRWLAQYNPTKKLYFGKPVPMKEHATPLDFAYGGAGIVLSGASVREFCVEKRGIAQRFAPRIYKWWFGDFILADALDEELNLRMTDALPYFNADSPDMLPFGKDIWCKPVVTLHHTDARYSDTLYRAEKNKNFSEFLFRDVYNAAYPQGLPQDLRVDWNAADYEHHSLQVPPKNIKPSKEYGYIFDLWDPHEKLEACELACSQHTNCFQWSFTRKTTHDLENRDKTDQTQCHLSGVFRLGQHRGADIFQNSTISSYKMWTSGWSHSRIQRFIDGQWDCKGRPSSEKSPDEKFDFHVKDDEPAVPGNPPLEI